MDKDILFSVRQSEAEAAQLVEAALSEAAQIMEAARNKASQTLEDARLLAEQKAQDTVAEAEAKARQLLERGQDIAEFSTVSPKVEKEALALAVAWIGEQLGHS